MFAKIYQNLCDRGKLLKDQYGPKSGLHRHHIHPSHSGGADDDDNYTYLTAREHSIAHFCLWKMNQNPNDLRSMKMLGVALTPYQRRATGIFCRDNKIGFFGAPEEQRSEWRQQGVETQKRSSTPEKTYWYWSTPEGRKRRAVLGGTASFQSPKSKWKFWTTTEGRALRAKMGGQKMASQKRKSMYHPETNNFKRVVPDEIPHYLSVGYKMGSNQQHRKGQKMGPSPKRKPLTDGMTVWAHAKEAAKATGFSLAMISLMCNSKIKSKPNWRFITLDEYERGLASQDEHTH